MEFMIKSIIKFYYLKISISEIYNKLTLFWAEYLNIYKHTHGFVSLPLECKLLELRLSLPPFLPSCFVLLWSGD
jgi:hypothetical protein